MKAFITIDTIDIVEGDDKTCSERSYFSLAGQMPCEAKEEGEIEGGLVSFLKAASDLGCFIPSDHPLFPPRGEGDSVTLSSEGEVDPYNGSTTIYSIHVDGVISPKSKERVKRFVERKRF
jgi:hypothetical protein